MVNIECVKMIIKKISSALGELTLPFYPMLHNETKDVGNLPGDMQKCIAFA
jgi:hypothetical protein